jgi:1-aminocyclopropane-1-carboxylate deaminase/D-cysteine desulfhydrase-like pyridoxal-dependent ACC family enzyme
MNNSTLQRIFLSSASDVCVFLKRDDLLHPQIQGNKWRKLAPFMLPLATKNTGILSFGGAFSNHLHALATAGKLFGIPTIGIVRGSAVNIENPTLSHARRCGMQIFPVTKVLYDLLKKADLSSVLSTIGIHSSDPFVLLPEGGDTVEALLGCTAITAEIQQQLPKDVGRQLYYCVPAGTGCTAAGVIAGAGLTGKTLVFPAAKYGVEHSTIMEKLTAAGYGNEVDFEIIEHNLPIKFAEMTIELQAFIEKFEQQEGILLDPIYTSKMMFTLCNMLEHHFFPPGSTVVALHTGGLQGWAGMHKHPFIQVQ